MSATPASGAQAASDATAQAATPTGTTSQADETESLSPAELRAALTAANKDAAANRTKLRAFERTEEERRQATLSEVEKRDARIRELEEHLTTAQRKERDYALRDAIAEAVTADNFPAAPVATAAKIIRLIEPAAIQWDDAGRPKNIAALLTGLVQTDPYLFRAKDRRPGPADAGGGGFAPVGDSINDMIRQRAGRG